MMEDTMKAINAIMRTCRDSLDDAADDYERSTLMLSIVFNVARLAGEEGLSRPQVAHHVLGAVATGYKAGEAQRIAEGPAH
jgi:hypothetical protein